MAATNKCLAQSNKSRTRAETTKQHASVPFPELALGFPPARELGCTRATSAGGPTSTGNGAVRSGRYDQDHLFSPYWNSIHGGRSRFWRNDRNRNDRSG